MYFSLIASPDPPIVNTFALFAILCGFLYLGYVVGVRAGKMIEADRPKWFTCHSCKRAIPITMPRNGQLVGHARDCSISEERP